MPSPLSDVETLLHQVRDADAATPTATLREWRTAMVRASVFVSYALGIYSVDAQILARAVTARVDDVWGALVNDLPELLSSGWVGGGWSLSPDASASVAAAAEFDIDNVAARLELHAEMVNSDLSNHDVTRDLLARVEEQRAVLAQLKDELAHQLQLIQKTVLERYATGDASVDDWF